MHICKVGDGWKVVFQSQDGKFSSFQELKEYYKNNKKSLIIVDEYGKEVKWDEFLDYIVKRNISLWNGEGLRSHLLLGWDGKDEYYLDTDGYEWTNREFC